MKPLLAALFVLSAAPVFAQELPPNHPPLGGTQAQAAPATPAAAPSQSAEELLKQLDQTAGLKEKDKTFQVAASLGKLYYGQGRFADARVYLQQATDKAEPLRSFYVVQRKKALAQKLDLHNAETAGCAFGPADSVEKQFELASQKAKANQTAAAATCARAALKPVLESRQLLAGAQFNSGDAKAALKTLDGNLEAAPDDPESLWAHASLLLETQGDEVKSLQRAKSEFEHTLTLSPDAPRNAWTKRILVRIDEGIAAGGLSKLDQQKYADAKNKAPAAPSAPMAMGGPFAGGNAPFAGGNAGGGVPAVSPEAMQAIQNTERTPEMIEGLKKLTDEAEDHLAHGRFQDALDNYKRVVPFEPENGRAKAGMAWSLVGLNKQPMADRVWQVAVQADPASVDALGQTLKQKGDEQGAKALWKKLADTDPSYAAQSGLAKRLE